MVNANSGWLFTADQLKNTPSVKDGMLIKEEDEKRREGCQIIWQIAALGCLFLAGKVEETPKKCKDIVAVAREFDEAKFGSRNLLNELFMFERTLLVTLGFDLYLENPYSSLLTYAKVFKIEKEIMRDIVQFAWTFLNDCAGTTLCLQYEPEIIAISILELSIKFHHIEMDKVDWHGKEPSIKWHEQFIDGLTQEIIEDVCHIALDYYEGNAKIAAQT
ncbi:hypothetical protein FO519_007839 [Halicephalobus sp. NKZ332]|nr:hypothetical protein FO519_007839 [Halicephalobus sp. NKZ332]